MIRVFVGNLTPDQKNQLLRLLNESGLVLRPRYPAEFVGPRCVVWKLDISAVYSERFKLRRSRTVFRRSNYLFIDGTATGARLERWYPQLVYED